MTKKLSVTQQWMIDHPDDEPCPKTALKALAWRRRRGLDHWHEYKKAERAKERARHSAEMRG